MPPIKSISVDKNELRVVNGKNIEYVFDASKIPADKDSIAKLENYLNTEWLPSVTTGNYQIQVHIYSLLPLLLNAWSADLGEKIPANWWLENYGD